MFDPITPCINHSELLVRDIHTYVNYDQLAEEAAEKGWCLKESKVFYGDRLLNSLEILLKGKSKEELERLLLDIRRGL